MPIIPSQRHLFDIPEDTAYFNCAYNSPQLREVTNRLLTGVCGKSRPWQRTAASFFEDAETVRRLAAEIFGGVKIVAVSPCHWINGACIDLAEVGKACRAVGAILVVDATQTLGAMVLPLDEVQPDFLVAAGYKRPDSRPPRTARIPAAGRGRAVSAHVRRPIAQKVYGQSGCRAAKTKYFYQPARQGGALFPPSPYQRPGCRSPVAGGG
jgi:kynureninase